MTRVENLKTYKTIGLCLAVLVMGTTGACGAVPGSTGTASSVRTSPSPPISSPSTSPSGAWQTYSDPQFGFTISYPQDFTIQDEGVGPPGSFHTYRFVASQYSGEEAPPQVDLTILAMDTDTLDAWIKRHTGTSSAPPSQAYYWETTSNLVATAAAGRSAISFDSSSQGFPAIAHETVFLLTPTRVIDLAWWTTDAATASATQSVAQQMLASFHG